MEQDIKQGRVSNNHRRLCFMCSWNIKLDATCLLHWRWVELQKCVPWQKVYTNPLCVATQFVDFYQLQVFFATP